MRVDDFAGVLSRFADAGDDDVGLRACATASAISASGAGSMVERLAEDIEPRGDVRIVDDVGALGVEHRVDRRARMPSSTVTLSWGCAATAQVPCMLARLSASGPTSAILPSRSSGSAPLFFSSTQDFAAASRARRRVIGRERHRVPALLSSRPRYGLSNRPSFCLARKHAAAGGVDVALGDASFRDQCRQMTAVAFARRGRYRRRRGTRDSAASFSSAATPWLHQFHDRGVVGHDQPVEAPALAQQIVQQFAMRGAGDAGEVVEADHDRADAGSTAALNGGSTTLCMR